MFFKSYWNYYLDLEDQLLLTKRFVDFGKENNNTFSIEYLKLLQATCSEIDVVAKIMAEEIDATFKKLERKDIQKWGYVIQNRFPSIENMSVIFNGDYCVTPWENWAYEKHTDAKGSIRYKLSEKKKTPAWWTAYNKVKHERTSHYKHGQANYVRANLGNLVMALSGLYVLETLYIEHLATCDSDIPVEKSKLFVLDKK